MQIFGVHESLLTVLARERILLRVLRDLVVFEMLLAVEAFRTLRTLVQRVIHVLRFVLF